jgi:hypothetical protein
MLIKKYTLRIYVFEKSYINILEIYISEFNI